MFWLTFPPLPQKVKAWTLMILLYLNTDHIFASQSRYSWTPIWRRRKHASSSITHHSGVTLLTQQVFKFSRDLESGVISFWFHQVQHSPSAPRKSRADSPLIQVWFQNLFMNIFCIFLTIILQLADHALSKLLGQPNTAIPSSSSQPLIPVGSNLEEIRLKQVTNYSFCWPIPLLFCFHRPS